MSVTFGLKTRSGSALLSRGELLGHITGLEAYSHDNKRRLLHLLVLNAGVSLTVNENTDSDVERDLDVALDRLLCTKGPTTAPVDAADLVIGKTLCIPLQGAQPCFGTWQGIYIIDRRHPAVIEYCPSITLVATIINDVTSSPALVLNSSRGTQSIDKLLPRDDAMEGAPFVLHLWAQHTSCSLATWVNTSPHLNAENKNVEDVLSDVVPDSWSNSLFRHTAEGPDDMPAHVKSTLVTPEVTVPFTRGAVGGNFWFSGGLCEHRNHSGSRRMHSTLSPLAKGNPEPQFIFRVKSDDIPKRSCRNFVLLDITEIVQKRIDDVPQFQGGLLHIFTLLTTSALVLAHRDSSASLDQLDVLYEKFKHGRVDSLAPAAMVACLGVHKSLPLEGLKRLRAELQLWVAFVDQTNLPEEISLLFAFV